MNEDIIITDINALLPSKMNEPVNFSNGIVSVNNIDEIYLEKNFKKRQIKKQDKFSLYAQSLVSKLIHNNKTHIDKIEPNNIGIILGNNTGGWNYVENQLINLYREGFDQINPYVATAWFPTAPQGEISISNNIKGYSKTICANRLSGGLALAHSYEILKDNICELTVTGSIESPNSNLVTYALNEDDKVMNESAIFILLEKENKLNRENKLASIIDIQCSTSFEINIKRFYENHDKEIDLIVNHNVEREYLNQIKNNTNNEVYIENFNDNNEYFSSESLITVFKILSNRKKYKNKTIMINHTENNSKQILTLILRIF